MHRAAEHHFLQLDTPNGMRENRGMKAQNNHPIFCSVCLLTASLFLLSACSKAPAQKADEVKMPEIQTPQAPQAQVIAASVSELMTDPMKFADKQVRIEGTITHVCRQSGDKMRVSQDGTELAILVKLGEFTGQLNAESEGSRVIVTGTLKTQIVSPEQQQVQAEPQQDGEAGHECATDKAAAEVEKAKGLDPKTVVFIELSKYELVKAE